MEDHSELQGEFREAAWASRKELCLSGSLWFQSAGIFCLNIVMNSFPILILCYSCNIFQGHVSHFFCKWSKFINIRDVISLYYLRSRKDQKGFHPQKVSFTSIKKLNNKCSKIYKTQTGQVRQPFLWIFVFEGSVHPINCLSELQTTPHSPACL